MNLAKRLDISCHDVWRIRASHGVISRGGCTPLILDVHEFGSAASRLAKAHRSDTSWSLEETWKVVLVMHSSKHALQRPVLTVQGTMSVRISIIDDVMAPGRRVFQGPKSGLSLIGYPRYR